MVTLTDEQYKTELEYCLQSIDRGRTKDNIKKAFDLHNMRLKQNGWGRETGNHCGGCQTRVINKLRAYYSTL